MGLTHNQQMFLYWVQEREAMRLKKEAGKPAPWSDNIVMCETYFCNIDREDDRVTRWIRQNWRYNWAHDIAMVAARIFNLPSTLKSIGQPRYLSHPGLSAWLYHVEKELSFIRQDKGQIWNGAYIISTNGKKMSKLDYCINLLKSVAKDPQLCHNVNTLAGAHKKLMQIEGLGSFLAAQVVADLKNTVGHPLYNAPDKRTFSAPGPGSLRGLTWFFEKNITNKTYQEAIHSAWDIVYWELPDEILDKLCMQNLQNCFCEYDKFMRVSTNIGRSKRKYKWEGK